MSSVLFVSIEPQMSVFVFLFDFSLIQMELTLLTTPSLCPCNVCFLLFDVLKHFFLASWHAKEMLHMLRNDLEATF